MMFVFGSHFISPFLESIRKESNEKNLFLSFSYFQFQLENFIDSLKRQNSFEGKAIGRIIIDFLDDVILGHIRN
jgi:hypothetical protein